MGNRLYIFNPETDYALGVNSRYYTLPEAMLELRRKKALFPAVYAEPGATILLLDKDLIENSETEFYKNLLNNKNIRVITLDILKKESSSFKKIVPWGWNRSLRHCLFTCQVPLSLLPSDKDLDNLRKLSHRRVANQFKDRLSELDRTFFLKAYKEVFTVDEALKFKEKYKKVFFKAPWSSAGRGVVNVDCISKLRLNEWLHGIIKRQGSVIAEEKYEKTEDFATEWVYSNGKAELVGYSLFTTDERGRYLNNQNENQDILYDRINVLTSGKINRLTDIQKQILEEIIREDYTGPLGVDMLIDCSGCINPCVEINFRMTMGQVNLISNGVKIDW